MYACGSWYLMYVVSVFTAISWSPRLQALLVIRETLRDEIEKERALIAQYKDELKKRKPPKENDHEESVCFMSVPMVCAYI